LLDIGWSEMAVILLVALIVIGPKDLPVLARNLGRWVGKARGMAREFQSSLEAMAREAELDKVRDEINRVGRTDLRKTVEKQIDPTGELGSAFEIGKPAKPAEAIGTTDAPGPPAATDSKPDPARATAE
jgi:sec-independent protein translocase protein TatB